MIETRAATKAELSALLVEIQKCTRGLTTALYGKNGLRTRLLRPKSSAGLSACTVAILSQQVVGHCYGYDLEKVANEKLDRYIVPSSRYIIKPFRELRVPNSWYISSVWVSEDYRDRGVGTALLRSAALEAERAGIGVVSLHAYSVNDGAIRLYTRLGFSILGSAPLPVHPDMSVTGGLYLMACEARKLAIPHRH